MPRTEEANQRIREELRANILEAALSVFACKGCEATAANIGYGLVLTHTTFLAFPRILKSMESRFACDHSFDPSEGTALVYCYFASHA